MTGRVGHLWGDPLKTWKKFFRETLEFLRKSVKLAGFNTKDTEKTRIRRGSGLCARIVQAAHARKAGGGGQIVGRLS